ncbi:MAG: hypothetical protein EZS28_021406, partial [Streblomastix strix]
MGKRRIAAYGMFFTPCILGHCPIILMDQ